MSEQVLSNFMNGQALSNFDLLSCIGNEGIDSAVRGFYGKLPAHSTHDEHTRMLWNNVHDALQALETYLDNYTQQKCMERDYLLSKWGQQFCRCGVTVAFSHEADLLMALAEFPSITLEGFIPLQGITSLAVMKLTDQSVVQEFLTKPWLIKLDMTNVYVHA